MEDRRETGMNEVKIVRELLAMAKILAVQDNFEKGWDRIIREAKSHRSFPIFLRTSIGENKLSVDIESWNRAGITWEIKLTNPKGRVLWSNSEKGSHYELNALKEKIIEKSSISDRVASMVLARKFLAANSSGLISQLKRDLKITWVKSGSEFDGDKNRLLWSGHGAKILVDGNMVDAFVYSGSYGGFDLGVNKVLVDWSKKHGIYWRAYDSLTWFAYSV